MSGKPHIVEGISANRVRAAIPPEFHRWLDESLLHGSAYSVISFPSKHGESNTIVDSKALKKALAKARSGAQVVAVGHNFTAEARDLLADINAMCFFASDFYWTDSSWASIRDQQS